MVETRVYRRNHSRLTARLVSCHTVKGKGRANDQKTVYTLRKDDGSAIELTGAQLREQWTWQNARPASKINHRTSTRAARRRIGRTL